jgi:hypothetical protein
MRTFSNTDNTKYVATEVRDALKGNCWNVYCRFQAIPGAETFRVIAVKIEKGILKVKSMAGQWFVALTGDLYIQ